MLPFGNVVFTVTIDGAELKQYLENGVSAMPAANGRSPQVSGLCFTYDISAPAGNRVTGAVRQAADGTCTGPVVDLTSGSTYTSAQNDFMATGCDGYRVVFSRGTTQDIMDQVLASYLTANTPISPSIQGRIVCTTSGATACPVVTPQKFHHVQGRGPENQISMGTVLADDHGEFSAAVLIPLDTKYGDYEFKAIEERDQMAIASIAIIADTSVQEGSDQREDSDVLLAPMPTVAPGVSSTALPQTTIAEVPVSRRSSATLISAILLGVGIIGLFSIRVLRKR